MIPGGWGMGGHWEWIDLPLTVVTILLLGFRKVSFWLQYERRLFPEHWSEARAAVATLTGCCAAWGLAYAAWFRWSVRHAWFDPFVVAGFLALLRVIVGWVSRAIFGEDLD